MTIKYRAKAPQPIAVEPMNCFAIAWFRTKHQATRYSDVVKKGGKTYLGGAFNGRPCGRDALFDKEIDGKLAFAVTFSGELYEGKETIQGSHLGEESGESEEGSSLGGRGHGH
jgi:hypothetical protein